LLCIKNKSAFTLAEVLITLAIVGVIASLTIPTLLQNTKKEEYVAGLKKSYSVLSQAYKLLESENNGNFSSLITGSDGASEANLMNAFATKLNVIKNCGSGFGCWYNSPRKFLNGSEQTPNLEYYYGPDGYGKAILNDGTMILIDITSETCTEDKGTGPLKNSTCGRIIVDINGAKAPNTIGRDIFYFFITKTGIVPFGAFDHTTCEPTIADLTKNQGCTAKVLKEGAMNY